MFLIACVDSGPGTVGTALLPLRSISERMEAEQQQSSRRREPLAGRPSHRSCLQKDMKHHREHMKLLQPAKLAEHLAVLLGLQQVLCPDAAADR